MLIYSTPIDMQAKITHHTKSTYFHTKPDIIRCGVLVICACLAITLIGCGSGSDANRPRSSAERVVVKQLDKPAPVSPTATLSPTSTPINHPLVLTFTPAPVNLPPPETTPAPIPPYVPRLPTGSIPIVIQSVNSSEFKGLLDMIGTITIDEQSIKMASDAGDESMIAYRLPQAMQELDQRTFSGRLRISDTSDIAATRQETWVFDDIGLVFADVFQTLEEPANLEIASGIRLMQREVNETETSDVFADIESADGNPALVRLPLFSPVSISATPRNFQVFLELSKFQKANPAIGDSITGYALHVWIVAITN